MKNAAKDFSPIAGDYDFFMAHATEAENDLRDYQPHLQRFGRDESPIRMLDFGCGAGEFTDQFLRRAAWPSEQLRLTLVEPVEEQRRQAAEFLRDYTAAPIEHSAQLAAEAVGAFDLIVINHVLYYVADLGETMSRLVAALAPGGLLLTAMAGRDNALFPFWERGFAHLGEPIPYWVAEDLEAALRQQEVPFRQERSEYVLAFPDTEDNRLKILRFLCADHLADMPVAELLAMFDAHAQGGQIEIHTHSRHFVIGPDD